MASKGRAASTAGAKAAGYLAAIAATVTALLLRIALREYLIPPFILFYPLVMLVALRGGLGPGLVSTALSAVFSAVWLLPGLRGDFAADGAGLLVFTGMGLFMSVVAQRYRTARSDLVERRVAEARAFAEKERLAVTLRSIGDAVIATDAAGRITSVNQVAEALTGWSSAQAAGRPLDEVFRIVNEGTRRVVESPVARVLREGVVVGLANHTALIAKDGSERPIADSGAPIRDAAGKMTGVVLVFRDQTEERRAEQALRESEERYRGLIEQSLAGIYVIQEGRFRYVNARFAEIFGYASPAELVDRVPMSDLVAPQDRELMIARHRDAPPGEVAEVRYSFTGQRRDGTPVQIEMHARSFVYEGRPARIGVLLDVTEQRRAEEESRLSARRARAIFEQAGVGMAQIESATGRFLEVNDKYCEITGYSREEMLAMRWQDLTHPDHLASDVTSAEAMLRTAAPYTKEKRYLRKDGSAVWVNLTVSPFWAVGEERSRQVAVVEDITARKQAEAAQQESERRLQALLKVTMAGHLITRKSDMKIIDVNDAWLAQFGFRRDEVIGHTSQELGCYGDLRDRARLVREFQASGKLLPVEIPMRRKTGEARTFVVTSMPADVGGEACYLSSWSDVTELRSTTRALEESEARYRDLFTLAPSGVVLSGPDGRLLAFNDLACEQLGYSRREMGELSIKDIDTEESKSEMDQKVSHLLAGGGLEFETRHRTRSGAMRDMLVRARPIEIDGESRFISVWHDITDRKGAETLLRHSEARFRAMIEKSTDMTILADVTGAFVFWSPSATEALGWSAEEAAAKRPFDLVHPEDKQKMAEALGRVTADTSAAVQVTVRLLHKNGTWRLVDGVGRNLLGDPAVRAVVINARDISDQRKLEDQYRQAQKLESVGRLAGGVAHDFNNLVTVILSCTEALKSDIQAGKPPDLEDIEETHAAGERARDLTRQLLTFARKQVIDPVVLDLNTVVRGSEKMLRRVLGEDVELKVEAEAGLWPVLCDAGQLEQVLMNLAVNARDAMPDGGSLTLETRNVELTEAEALARSHAPAGAGQWVRLRVSDSGCGMPAEVRAHLFEPFFTTKGVGKGTGLGLATVHGIVAQSGGHIHVESEPGKGTTFEVCLPRSRVQRAVVAAAPAKTSSRGTETLLVIEDDPQMRWVTVRALQRAGYQVLVAPNGAQALVLARESARIDLVVTDVVMPGMSGRAVVDELRRQRPGVRALFVSGYTQDAISHRGVLDAGLNFLPKPFTPTSLLARVRTVLDAPA